MAEKKAVTIKDIARIAGVSHSTVSRSLNNSPLISGETKDRIKRLARELNFAFNSSAQSLSTSKTGTVGVIFPELFNYFGNSLYMGMLLHDIRESFDRFSIDSITTFASNKFTGESNIRRLISRRKIDGLLIVHPEIAPKDWEYIERSKIPFVVLHFKPRSYDYSNMNYFFSDHLHGGLIATRKLISSGCRNILCLREDSVEPQFHERTLGYAKALEEAGMPFQDESVIKGMVSLEFGYRSILELGEGIKSFDGIFAEADLIAIGAIEALKSMGIKVPEDIKVVGYDDTELGEVFHPKLTTIHQPREEHARLACARLVELIEGDDDLPIQAVVQPRLVVRESCP